MDINFTNYESEAQMPDIIRLIEEDLSEPYSVYTYRYFINNWAKLCFLAYFKSECVGAIVCKLDTGYKGYIAMLVVKKDFRKLGIGSKLVIMAVEAMRSANVEEIVLETVVNNQPALKLYKKLGFLADRRLFRYYLNGFDALRLKLWMSMSAKTP